MTLTWKNPPVPYDIHIRTADGGVQYPSAFSYGVEDGILRVQVGVDLDQSDQIYFAPGYWQQYVIDPHDEDPLDLGLLETKSSWTTKTSWMTKSSSMMTAMTRAT